MTQVSHNVLLSRAGRYKFISGKRNPGFDTILKVLGTLGQKLQAGTAHGLFPGPTRKGSRTLHEGEMGTKTTLLATFLDGHDVVGGTSARAWLR